MDQDSAVAVEKCAMDIDIPRTPSPQPTDIIVTPQFLNLPRTKENGGKDIVSPLQATSMAHTSINSAAFNPSSSKTASSSSSMNKRQQAAHRARMTALHKQLTTRLQYAAFKVEHGWSKQSLSEVENLFYKHRRVSGSNNSPKASKGTSTSPSAIRTKITSTTSSATGPASTTTLPPPPTTPTPPSWRASSPHHVRKYRTSSGSTSVEGPGGLVTPPASGNTLPSSSSYERSLMKATGGSSSSSNSQQSPSSGHRKTSLGNGGNVGHSGRSYADFWSKIGGAVSQANATNSH